MKAKSVRASGGQCHPTLTREHLELQNALSLCRQAIQNAKQVIANRAGIRAQI
jgi:hypothetical protein